MSSAGNRVTVPKGTTVSVYLHSAGFVVLVGNRVLHVHEGEDTATNVQCLHQWLVGAPASGSRGSTGKTGLKCKVFLSAALCRPFLAQIPDGLTEQESDRAWVAAATTRTGVSEHCTVWREVSKDTQPIHPRKQIAAVLESSLLTQLLEVPGQDKGRKAKRSNIVSIQPAWSQWLRVCLEQDPRTGCVVLHELDGVTVLSGQNGEFEVASTVLAGTDPALTQSAVDRLLLVAAVSEAPPRQARLRAKAVHGHSASTSDLAAILEILN